MNGVLVTNSDLADNESADIQEGEPFLGFPSLGEDMSTGDSIPEAEIISDVHRAIERPLAKGRHTTEEEKKPRDAKSGPPSLDEWTGFLSRVVLRTACDWYINLAFRGIDEDSLTERELERLALSDDEKKLIAVPFAELAYKSKLMRKHGRAIVASGDAFNAVVVLGAWSARVRRIAARHRPPQAKRGKVTINNGSSRQSTAPPDGTEYFTGANGGRVSFGNGVIPGSG